MTTQTNLTATIDAYGILKAQMAELELKKKALESMLADLPAGTYDGEIFQLAISQYDSETPDKVLADEIKNVVDTYRATLSRQYLKAHTVVKPVRRHKASARNGKALAA